MPSVVFDTSPRKLRNYGNWCIINIHYRSMTSQMAACDTVYPPLRPPGSVDVPAPSVGRVSRTEPDDDSLVLSRDQGEQVDRFRCEIRLCETDDEKYDLCVRTRDRLLAHHSGLLMLIAACERVMFVECAEYKQWRENRDKRRSRPTRPKDDDAAQWELFSGVAADGSTIESRCLSALKEVARCWGRDVVQHYQWASKGENFCNKLRAAARKVSAWDEAVTKLNRLMLRRLRLLGRRPPRHSADPIDPADLANLKAWSHKNPFVDDRNAGEDPFRTKA